VRAPGLYRDRSVHLQNVHRNPMSARWLRRSRMGGIASAMAANTAFPHSLHLHPASFTALSDVVSPPIDRDNGSTTLHCSAPTVWRCRSSSHRPCASPCACRGSSVACRPTGGGSRHAGVEQFTWGHVDNGAQDGYGAARGAQVNAEHISTAGGIHAANGNVKRVNEAGEEQWNLRDHREGEGGEGESTLERGTRHHVGIDMRPLQRARVPASLSKERGSASKRRAGNAPNREIAQME